MNDAILGALVGGGITGLVTLIALRFTLDAQRDQAIRAEGARIRERRSERLRDAYRDLVAGALEIQTYAKLLPIALAAADQGDPKLREMLAVPRNLTMDQSAGLRLEADPDQTIITTYNTLNSELTTFLAKMGGYLERDERMPSEEWLRLVEPMDAKATEIGEAARRRLEELDTPAP